MRSSSISSGYSNQLYIYAYGSKHLLRRYLTPQIMSQTLPKKVLGSIGYIYNIYIYKFVVFFRIHWLLQYSLVGTTCFPQSKLHLHAASCPTDSSSSTDSTKPSRIWVMWTRPKKAAVDFDGFHIYSMVRRCYTLW